LETIQEWSDFMKTSSRWNFRFIGGKIMMGLVLAAMISSINVLPALGKDEPKRKGNYDNGRYEQRGPGYDRYHHPVHRSYGYKERGYGPPPVIYAPPPPPGITIFFPPIFIRP
jgi:hypothetical protein